MNSEVEVLRAENEELKRRNRLLQGQVIALSRAPVSLSRVVKALQAEISALRIGAKRRLTEKQLRDSGEWNNETGAKAQMNDKTSEQELDEIVADVGEAS